MITEPTEDAPTEETYLLEVSRLAQRHASRFLLTDDVDDLAQDIVFECLQSVRAGRPMMLKGLSSFIRTIVVRRLVDAERAQECRDWKDVEYANAHEAQESRRMSPDGLIETGELDALVARTLDSMTLTCQTVVRMVREDEKSYMDVSEALGISTETVRWHLVRARRKLRAALNKFDADLLSRPVEGGSGSKQRTSSANSRNEELPERAVAPASQAPALVLSTSDDTDRAGDRSNGHDDAAA